jgi:hypothetical protein
MKSNDIFVPLLAGGFAATLLILNANKNVQEKSIYLEYCNDFKHNAFSCPTHTIVSKISFKIFVEQQFVVSGTFSPQKYSNCSVYDKDNWLCDKGEGKIIGISDGNFLESNNGSIGKNGQHSTLPLGSQIPYFMYYIRSILDFFKIFSR